MLVPLLTTPAQAAESRWTGDLEVITPHSSSLTLVDKNRRLYNLGTTGSLFNGKKLLDLPAEVTPGLYDTHPATGIYTDENGHPYQDGKLVSDTETYAPNSLYTDNVIADSSGQLRRVGTSVIAGPPKITPNIRVGFVFVDGNGRLWSHNRTKATDITSTIERYSTVKLQPNQYSTLLNNFSFFSNEKGELLSSTGEKTGVTGLPAGMVYPNNIAIVDNAHNIWECSKDFRNTLCEKATSNDSLKAGTWDQGGVQEQPTSYFPITLLASDNEGVLSTYVTGSGWQIHKDIKTKPNILELSDVGIDTGSSVIFDVAAQDGAIWQISVSRIASVATITPIMSDAASSDEAGPTVIACAPTTGVVPSGLSVVGLSAVGVGLLGVLLVFVRRRHV